MASPLGFAYQSSQSARALSSRCTEAHAGSLRNMWEPCLRQISSVASLDLFLLKILLLSPGVLCAAMAEAQCEGG